MMFLVNAGDSASRRLLNSWVNPGERHRVLPPEAKPVRDGYSYVMPYTEEARREILNLMNRHGDVVKVYLAEELTYLEAMNHRVKAGDE